MKPALVYIAGAYRAPTPWEVEQNVRNAESASLYVATLGAVPVCPHTMYRFFDRAVGLSSDYWLQATLEIMRRCDAVYVLRGPRTDASQGTQGELVEAARLGIAVCRTPLELCDWLEWKERAGDVEVLR